eukprot:g5080.t1
MKRQFGDAATANRLQEHERGSVYQVLEQARAVARGSRRDNGQVKVYGARNLSSLTASSMSLPLSRPVTPADTGRSLFSGDDYRPQSRPSSAFSTDDFSQREAFHADVLAGGVIPMSMPQNAKIGQAMQRRQRRRQRKSKGKGKEKKSLKSSRGGESRDSQRRTVEPAADWGWGGDSIPNDGDRETATTKDFNGMEEGQEVDGGSSDGTFNLASLSEHNRGSVIRKLEDTIENLEERQPGDDFPYSKIRDAENLYAEACAASTEPGTTEEFHRTLRHLRRKLLRKAYDLLGDASPQVIICAARLTLRMAAVNDTLPAADSHKDRQKRHKRLLTALRALFQLSKQNRNDKLFYGEQVLHILMEMICGETLGSSPAQQPGKEASLRRGKVRLPLDVLIYATGTLKNISTSDDRNQNALAQQGAVLRLTDLLRAASALSKAGKGNERQIAQLLIQVTGTLRNLCMGSKKHFGQFWSSRTVEALSFVLQSFSCDHTELMLNIVRVLSKLSLQETGRSQLTGGSDGAQNIQNILFLCARHSKHNAMLVRSLFVLGNLTSGTDDRNRERIADCVIEMDERGGREAMSGFELMLSTLHEQASNFVNFFKKGERPDASTSLAGRQRDAARQTEEVLVKTVRVVANLAIAPSIGQRLANSSVFSGLSAALSMSSIHDHGELILNILGAITNISFYASQAESEDERGFRGQSLTIVKLLVELILDGASEDIVLESLRVFGNFSRSERLRREMGEARVNEVVLLLLNHSNSDVVKTVCGILLNIGAHEAGKELLTTEFEPGNIESTGLHNLLRVLRSAGLKNLEVAIHACKALHNHLLPPVDRTSGPLAAGGHMPRIIATSVKSTILEVCDIIEEILDEETSDEDSVDGSGNCNEDDAKGAGGRSASCGTSFEQEFLTVGRALVEEIDTRLHDLVPLDEETDPQSKK